MPRGGWPGPVIYLPEKRPLDMYRFTLAHEIGHAILHRNVFKGRQIDGADEAKKGLQNSEMIWEYLGEAIVDGFGVSAAVIDMVKHKDPRTSSFWYGIHEVFYNEPGRPFTMTEDPVDIAGRSPKEIREYLSMIQRDIERLPVLDARRTKWVKPPWDSGKRARTPLERVVVESGWKPEAPQNLTINTERSLDRKNFFQKVTPFSASSTTDTIFVRSSATPRSIR